MVAFCKACIEILGFKKDGEILDYLNDYWLLKNDCTPWSYLKFYFIITDTELSRHAKLWELIGTMCDMYWSILQTQFLQQFDSAFRTGVLQHTDKSTEIANTTPTMKTSLCTITVTCLEIYESQF